MKNIRPEILNVKYSLGKYPIYIGEGLLSNSTLLKKQILSTQIMIVSNETVANFYLKNLLSIFEKYQCDHLILPDGEKYKNFESFKKILDRLAENQYHRDTTLIALGGGVIGDMTGFAASCYHRGIAYLQIPTTLLAQVDASIGGKTAINHPKGKNLIGAFYQPHAVIIDTKTLLTLPDREFKAGVAEVIKSALIADISFFVWLEINLQAILQKNSQVLVSMIKKAVHIKAKIVALDEKEKTGKRALLNLGHTFAHAIEQNLGYGKILHGEAVAIGIILAAHLSMQLGWIDEKSFEKIVNIFNRIDLPIQLPSELECDKLIETMMSDKKIIDGKLHLILLKSMGQAVIVNDVKIETIKKLIKEYLAKQ